MADDGRIAMTTNAAKVALVTGASSGIGRAIADRLAADGLRGFGTSRKGSTSDMGDVEMISLDVCSDESVRACIDTVLQRAGRIDVLVSNAGYLLSGAVEEATIAEAKAQFETNFFGAFRVIKAVLPTMRAQGAGRVINVTSLAGVVPLPFWGFYNASKFALEGLTETLRYELQPFGIRVSAIEAGSIKTRFYADDHKTAPINDYEPWRRRFAKQMAEFERKGARPRTRRQRSVEGRPRGETRPALSRDPSSDHLHADAAVVPGFALRVRPASRLPSRRHALLEFRYLPSLPCHRLHAIVSGQAVHESRRCAGAVPWSRTHVGTFRMM
jgi:NAD(P)-dependent dehydrogenase (short-subunit alcohol dehydrogenase family)